MARQTKKFSEVPVVGTINQNQRVMLTDPDGGISTIGRDDFKAALCGEASPEAALDGVFICAMQSSQLRLVKPSKWASAQAQCDPCGVALVSGGKALVVGLDSSGALPWSTAAGAGGGTATIDRRTALADWNGESNAAAQGAKAACGQNTAVGYCRRYDKGAITAGHWRLPSLAEMLLVYANIEKVNYALSLISGATPIASQTHWCSTEGNQSHAWYLSTSTGMVAFTNKVDNLFLARPVADIQ